MEWAISPLRKYADFAGRARRREYWSFVLLFVLAFASASLIDRIAGLRGMIGPYGPLAALVLAALAVPAVAAAVRRLHDTNRTGWWLMAVGGPLILSVLLSIAGPARPTLATILLLLAGAGAVLLIAFLAMEGTRGPNAYPADSKGLEGGAAGAE